MGACQVPEWKQPCCLCVLSEGTFSESRQELGMSVCLDVDVPNTCHAQFLDRASTTQQRSPQLPLDCNPFEYIHTHTHTHAHICTNTETHTYTKIHLHMCLCLQDTPVLTLLQSCQDEVKMRTYQPWRRYAWLVSDSLADDSVKYNVLQVSSLFVQSAQIETLQPLYKNGLLMCVCLG